MNTTYKVSFWEIKKRGGNGSGRTRFAGVLIHRSTQSGT